MPQTRARRTQLTARGAPAGPWTPPPLPLDLRRGQIYAALWTHMLKSRGAEAAGWRPFAWVMDLTSGSRSNLRLRRAFEARGAQRGAAGRGTRGRPLLVCLGPLLLLYCARSRDARGPGS